MPSTTAAADDDDDDDDLVFYLSFNIIKVILRQGKLQGWIPPPADFFCFVLRFYSPINPLGSCQAQSIYPTTCFPGQAMSPKQLTSTCAHSFARNWQLPFLNQQKGENDCRKYFIINLQDRILPDLVGIKPVTSWSPVGHAPNWATEGSAVGFEPRKWVPTTNVSIKKIRKKSHKHYQIRPLLIFGFKGILRRQNHILPQVFPVILKNLSTQCGD